MNTDKDALEHIGSQALAVGQTDKLNDTDFPCALFPNSMSIHSLEQYQEHRNQFRGTFTTPYIEAFSEYIKKNKADGEDKNKCFLSSDIMEAGVIFDLGNPNKAGHCKHTASIQLKQTAAYKAFKKIVSDRLTQNEAAEFIEDWRDYITLFGDDDKKIDVTHGIAALRRVVVKETSESESLVSQFSAKKSGMDEIDANAGDNKLPSFLKFTCVPYHGLDAFVFTCRINVVFMARPVKDVGFRFAEQLAEQNQEEIADEFQDKLTKSVGDNADVIIGSFDAS